MEWSGWVVEEGGWRVEGGVVRVQGAAFGVEGARCRVQGAGGQGSGVREEGWAAIFPLPPSGRSAWALLRPYPNPEPLPYTRTPALPKPQPCRTLGMNITWLLRNGSNAPLTSLAGHKAAPDAPS